ncbi:hypothetical protein ILYODFUR_039152 [Ilyodon furcidens]|uniref:Uncharacterized protein n=1 Tax=Ilyodon furcidens TaxID=33524 RepID=A0ABV0UQ04_9TELE
MKMLSLCLDSGTGKMLCALFRKHESSKYHREAVVYDNIYSSQEQTILSQLDAQLKVKPQHRCDMLVKEITSIMYLMGQDMALDSNNPTNSNLHKLLELHAQDCLEIYQ